MADELPSEDELRQQLEDELRRLKVSDVVVQTIYTLSSLGYRRLTAEDRDLDQARLAIEALRALVPVLEGAVPEDVIRDFNQVRANMQLAYAKAVADAGREEGPTTEAKTDDGGGEQPGGASDQP